MVERATSLFHKEEKDLPNCESTVQTTVDHVWCYSFPKEQGGLSEKSGCSHNS
jgi:hypothetical protein